MKHKASTKGRKTRFRNVKEFAKYLEENPDLLKYKHGDVESTLKAKVIKSKKTKKLKTTKSHLIIYDPNLLKKANKGNEAFCDGTFKSSPQIRNVKQLLTIMAKINNAVCKSFFYLKSYSLILCMVQKFNMEHFNMEHVHWEGI